MDQNQQQNQTSVLSKITGIVVKVLPIIAIVFLAFAIIAFMYNTIMGLTAGSFRGFLSGFANGISACLSNIFMASVLFALAKITSKK